MGLTTGLTDLLDHVGDWGLLATDKDLSVTVWNRWLELRSGLPAASVLGRRLFDLFPDLSTRRLHSYYHQALAGQTVLLSQRFHKYLLPLPTVPGGFGPPLMQQTVRIVPLMDGPAVTGTLTLIEDVTERVVHEAELLDRARQQAALAALARTALTGRDVGDVVQEVVTLARDTLGVELTEILAIGADGRSWVTLAGHGLESPRSVYAAETDVPRALSVLDADAVFAAEDVAAHPNLATDSHLRAHGVASALLARIPGRGSLPFGLLGAYTRSRRRFGADEAQFVQSLADILGVATERKRLDDELRLRVGELAEADRRKDEFLAMLAHELRNPLAPVRNGIQVLRMHCRDDAVVETVGGMMARQVGQLARLVDDLLDVSRISRGKVNLRRERVGLEAVVGQAVEASRPIIDARGHELSVSVPHEAVHLDADATRLTQAIGNLLSNAAKYTPEGGHVWLTALREGDEAVIRIRDNGMGIPPEMLPRVFDLFTQVDRTLDRSQGGLGIGLTLVRSLVEMHGGTVSAASAGPGRGSEFVVRLPALPHDPRPEAGSDGEKEPLPPQSPRRILIVDDNVDSADSLAMLLTMTGHEARTAHSGAEALETARDYLPRVVLLDIGLPQMDGYEVARQLRRRPELAGVVLLAMTGYGQEEDRRRSREAGFDHHLVKPVDPNELQDLLRRLPVVRDEASG